MATVSPSVRRRRRPRVRSVSFHTLWWLVRREAVLRILYPRLLAQALPDTWLRKEVLVQWRRRHRAADRVLAVNPPRKMYP
mgnify:FL=1